MKNSVKILGNEFSTLNLKETIELIKNKVEESNNKTFHIITANPEIVIQTHEDLDLKKIALQADLITPDGIGIIFASMLKRKPITERVTGYDLLIETLNLGNQKGWSFYFFGAEEAVNKKVVEIVSIKYPNINVVGRHNGYYNKNDESKIIVEICNSKPDILIVALGSPLADKWIWKYKKELDATTKVVFGVGGALDVFSGKIKLAPKIWRELNLEWLYRRISEPSRKERQKKLKKFVYRAILEALGIKRY